MYKIIPIFILIIAGCSKGPGKKERRDIFAFKEMSDLATVEYTITKVVKAKDNATWFKIGDRKILMSVVAYLKAGIDLSAIKEENTEIQKDRIRIQLPHAKLISLNIPPEEIREESQETGFWRSRFTNEEKNELLIQAEQNIRESVDSLGILQSAEEYARIFIVNFVKRLGYKDVDVSFDAITKEAVLPKAK